MLHLYTSEQHAIGKAPPSLAPMVLGINYALVALASLMVACRILVKGRLGKLGLEDALIVLSTLITLTLIVLTHIMVRYGFGMHLTDIQLEWWPEYGKYSYVHMTLGCITYPLTKISMIIFYLRLAPHATFRRICITTIGSIIVTTAIMTLMGLFGCTPVSGGWDHSPELGARCIDPQPYLYFYTVVNIMTDVLLMVLPIPILSRLHLRPHAKYGLIAMFAIGILITAISAYGLFAMYRAFHTDDVTWDGAKSWMWALAEFNGGIIVACMPSMLLFGKWVRGNVGDKKQKAAAGTPGPNGTIGSGGKRAAKRPDYEMVTRTSVRLGSCDYLEGEGKAEVLVVEVERGSAC